MLSSSPTLYVMYIRGMLVLFAPTISVCNSYYNYMCIKFTLCFYSCTFGNFYTKIYDKFVLNVLYNIMTVTVIIILCSSVLYCLRLQSGPLQVNRLLDF